MMHSNISLYFGEHYTRLRSEELESKIDDLLGFSGKTWKTSITSIKINLTKLRERIPNFDDLSKVPLTDTIFTQIGGGSKKYSPYMKTSEKHTGRDKVPRVVYVKNGKRYVKRKPPKTSKFVYREIK